MGKDVGQICSICIKMHNRLLVPLLVIICACSESGSSHEGDLDISARFGPGLRAAAERLATAGNDGDLDVQTELAHPRLVEGMGGVAKYRARLTRAKAQMSSGAPKVSIVGEPIVRRQGDRLFGMVRFEMELAGPLGKRGTGRSFFVAESSADGKSWRFLDGAGLAGDVAKLRRVIPDWPADLPLLDVQQPVFR